MLIFFAYIPQVRSEVRTDEQRFCVTLGSLGVSLQAQDNECKEDMERKDISIIKPVPFQASEFISMSKSKQRRIFMAWKNLVEKHRHVMGYQAPELENEPQNQHPQLSGEVVRSLEEIRISISSSFLVITLDCKTLERFMNFYELILEASEVTYFRTSHGKSVESCQIFRFTHRDIIIFFVADRRRANDTLLRGELLCRDTHTQCQDQPEAWLQQFIFSQASGKNLRLD